MSAAARTARSASSSCSCGMPNTAITASPMNFSTEPPWRSSAVRIASKYRPMTLRIDSGSRRSPSSVEPVTSQKTIETVLRTSAVSAASSRVPQTEQKLAPSPFSEPQFGQAVTAGV